ncbi:MAG: hypothetical protein ABIH27_03170 [Candidatus Omnitrophota bacterium]
MDHKKNILKFKFEPEVIAILKIAILLLISLGLILYLVFSPALKRYRELNKQFKVKSVDLVKLEGLIKESALLKQELDKDKADIELIKYELFWGKDAGNILAELTLLADGLEIEFVSVKPEPMVIPKPKAPEKKKSSKVAAKQKDSQAKKAEKEELPDFPYIPISVDINSGYENFIKFLSRIEEADRFIKINTYTIESGLQDIYRHKVRMKLVIYTEERVKI